MSQIRPAIVRAYQVYLLAIAAYAAVEWLRGVEPVFSWFGLLLAAAGPLGFFIGRKWGKPGRSERHPLAYSMVSGLGLAITMAMSWRYGNSAGLVHAWAGAAFIGWIAYLRWFASTS